jgi:hypothetical protein
MNIKTKIAVLIGVAALMLAPTAAFAGGPEYAPEKPPKPAKPMPGPNASMPEKAKAYGVYCKGFSKKAAKGQSGTPFSRCVTAMAAAAGPPKKTPGQACKALPKTHVKGKAGTEFSRCVTAAAQAKKAATQV